MVRWLLLLTLLPSCGTGSLADFSTSELTLEVQANGRILVELSEARGNCATLGRQARATLNGRPMVLDFAGGETSSAQGWSCQAPRFSLEATGAEEKNARVVVEDGSATLVLEARNVFVERGLVATRFEEDDENGHKHKRVTFRWIPETDSDRTASWKLEGQSGGSQFGEAQVDSDVLSVDLPDHGTLRMDGRATAPILRCEGVSQCTARVRASTGDLAI